MNPLPNEIHLKQWLLEEAERKGISTKAVWYRLNRGKYPDVTVRRVNKRVVFVSVKGK